MYVTMALILAAASIYVEFKLVKSVPGLHQLVEKYGLVGLGMSVGLSVLLGGLFGAAGITVMIAGLVSTAITNPVYRVRGTVVNGTPEQKQKIENAKKVPVAAYNVFLRPSMEKGFVVLKASTKPLWTKVQRELEKMNQS